MSYRTSGEYVRTLAGNTKFPRNIDFSSWSETPSKTKRKLINDTEFYDAIENFAIALNNRNDFLRAYPNPVAETYGMFLHETAKCIIAYKKLQDIGFVN